MKNKCLPVNILCQDYSPISGACTGCFSGYKLSNGECVLTTASNSDVNCKTYNANAQCVECYNGYFVRVGKCEKVNLLCQTSNPQTGACLSCYQGYSLSNGDCVLGGSSTSGDVNCKEFTDSTKKSCNYCYSQYYSKLGVCTKFNDLCKTSNPMNGICLDCYQGYALLNGDCVIAQQMAANVSSDPYCIKYENNKCTKCSSGFYLNQTSQCNQGDPLCKTLN